MKVTTYQQAFEIILEIPFNERLQECIKYLELEGYKEYSIAYVIWKTQDKLLKYKEDSRFCSILQNEVRKNTYTQQQFNDYRDEEKNNAKK